MLRPLLNDLSTMLGLSVHDYCYIEANDIADESGCALVARDGGLITFVRIDGAYNIIGKQAFVQLLDDVSQKIASQMMQDGYRLQFVFERDPDRSTESVMASMKSSYETAERLNLNIKGLLDERLRVMAGKTVHETCTMVLTTMPSALTPVARKQAYKKQGERPKEDDAVMRPGAHAQTPYVVLDELRTLHQAYVSLVEMAISGFCALQRMTAEDALRMVRSMCERATSPDWSPRLIGGPVSISAKHERGAPQDLSHILPLSIGEQMFTRKPRVESGLVDMGGVYYAPLLMDIPPQNFGRFDDLLTRFPMDLPWRVSITVTSGHDRAVQKVGMKRTITTFLAWSNRGANMPIKAACEQLLALSQGGNALAFCEVSAVTWGSSVDETHRRRDMLSKLLQSWGTCDVVEEYGSPLEAWFSTMPSFLRKSISNVFVVYMRDALTLLPLTRPLSPWSAGPCLFRTMDGKLFPFWPGSKLQPSTVDMCFAKPGSGKSLKLAADNLALMLAPGAAQLPRIAILDIGYSSRSFVELVQAMLPKDQRHLAAAIKMEMTKEYAINPFDTPLGCRRPLSLDKAFLVNMLSLLLTPADSREGVKRLTEFASAAINAMYEYCSPDQQPRMYQRNMDESVDRVLADNNVDARPGETTWWEVVDALHGKHLNREAARAQRYAVPTLNDLSVAISNSRTLKTTYGQSQLDSGESMFDFVNSMIPTVVADYPILAQRSSFDLGQARIISLDLSSVAKSGSAADRKQTAVMYMLGRYMLCRDFYRNLETLAEIPDAYKEYHRNIIIKDDQVVKKICMDEYHRTAGIDQVRLQVMTDAREGRKFNVHLIVLSQLLEDFGDDLMKMATNIYIMSKSLDEGALKDSQERFALGDDAMYAMRRYVTGPSPEGAPMLYLGAVEGAQSRVEQIIRLTLGGSELWAYTTTPDDVNLRRRLAERVGLEKALEILAAKFPGGSARNLLEEMSMQAQDGVSAHDRMVAHLLQDA